MLALDFEVVDADGFGDPFDAGQLSHAVVAENRTARGQFVGLDKIPMFDRPSDVIRRATDRLLLALDVHADRFGGDVREGAQNDPAFAGTNFRAGPDRNHFGRFVDAEFRDHQHHG